MSPASIHPSQISKVWRLEKLSKTSICIAWITMSCRWAFKDHGKTAKATKFSTPCSYRALRKFNFLMVVLSGEMKTACGTRMELLITLEAPTTSLAITISRIFWKTSWDQICELRRRQSFWWAKLRLNMRYIPRPTSSLTRWKMRPTCYSSVSRVNKTIRKSRWEFRQRPYGGSGRPKMIPLKSSSSIVTG